LDELIRSLARDYDVLMPYRVLNAAEHGVPQDRRRLFLVGARKGLKLPVYPASAKRVTCAEALADIPDAGQFPELMLGGNAEVEFGTQSAYARTLREIGNKLKHFGYRRLCDHGLLTSSMRADHSPASRQRFAATEQGHTEPTSRFHKLDPHGVCNTLRAGT